MVRYKTTSASTGPSPAAGLPPAAGPPPVASTQSSAAPSAAPQPTGSGASSSSSSSTAAPNVASGSLRTVSTKAEWKAVLPGEIFQFDSTVYQEKSVLVKVHRGRKQDGTPDFTASAMPGWDWAATDAAGDNKCFLKWYVIFSSPAALTATNQPSIGVTVTYWWYPSHLPGFRTEQCRRHVATFASPFPQAATLWCPEPVIMCTLIRVNQFWLPVAFLRRRCWSALATF